MASNNIKAVFFDLGETIFNYGDFDKTKAIKQAASLSYDYLADISQPTGTFLRYFLRHLIEIRLRYVWSEWTGREFNSLDVMKNRGARKGYHLTEEQWSHFHWLWYKPLSEICEIEHDLPQTLDKLTNMGLKLGIISNTFINGCSLDRHLESFGILHYFPIRVYSCSLGIRKPHPEIFRYAARQAKLDINQIVYVGDRIDFDVIGSSKAGMNPVLKRAFSSKNKSIPAGTFAIDRLSELPGLLESAVFNSD
ncbi:Pyrimidine 5'-nucleotidase YjjG [Limihaloglobus sulfuriphilus]|uniref:Pyrimidine 5'-nucleotidase YjjG n=1 Tax=Limihaloglobus sulfuriphilus TaxID=1851148 RepID=A0A1Q2MCP8_9BACT|nr:HAD family hydrolase [Limihaloglobus sulfuriphilus]AQQ70465.1 Pyrimidine 5'-nucleotidase YjjG [Limihaloglobus sulfuriphilus]